MTGSDPDDRIGTFTDDSAASDRLEAVFDDTDATATEYRERGWTAVACHPGDVNPVADAARLDALLPGSEFDEANERLSDASVDAIRVYAADEAEAIFRLVVVEDADAELAVCVPTFVVAADVAPLRAAAHDAGRLVIRLRPLDDRDHVEFVVDEPEAFFRSPPEE